MIVATLLAVLTAGTVASDDVTIQASVSDDLSTIAVTYRRRGVEPTVVLAADRYRRAPANLHASVVRQLYLGGFSPGGFDDLDVRIGGQRCEAPQLRAGGEGEVRCRGTGLVEAKATLRVPERLGPFGRHRRTLTLAGGWYPYVPGTARSHHVEIEVPAHLIAVVGGRRFAGRGNTRWTLRTKVDNVAQVTLLLRPAHARVDRGAGAVLRYVHLDRDGARAHEVIRAFDDALLFWREEGFGEPKRRVIGVETPLRHNLVRACEDVVLISDRAFRILPFERAQRFHRFPIARELFTMLLVRDRGLSVFAADAVASWLVDRYIASRYGAAEDAFDVLDSWSFIPAIDAMLYAPDVAFVDTYFRVVREEDPLRDEFIEFPEVRPRGKIVYHKLFDLRGKDATDAVMREVLAGASLERATSLAAGDQFVATWFGEHPNVQYRLAEVTSLGRHAAIVIERQGDVVAEPIEVRLVDEEGQAHLLRAEATIEARRVLTATLAAELASVRLDPRGRIAETPTAEVPSPRFDNVSEREWEVLLNNFNLLISATEGAIDTAIDVGFYQKFDVRWRYGVRLDYAPDAITLGATARYGFGERITPASLSQWVGLGVTGDYLRSGFAGEEQAGTAASLVAFWGYDNRKSVWAPEGGTALRASVAYNHVFGSIPNANEGTTRDSVAVTVRALQAWLLDLGHVISLRGSFGFHVQGQPRPQLLYALGGRFGAKGYALDADVGRYRAIASAEWLHPLLPDVETNALWLIWLTGIDGALFADVAVIGDALDQIGDGPLLTDVGYGLRMYLDWFGVRPGVMAIDLAFPLTATRGASVIGPPAVYIDYAQSFLIF